MPKISLAPPRRATDETVRSSGLIELIDGYCDQEGEDFALLRRGGLWNWWNTGKDTGVDGLYFWAEKQILVIVVEGEVFAFSGMSENDSAVQITNQEKRLNVGSPVSFATNGRWLFMCNNSKMLCWDGDADVRSLTASPVFSTVCFLAGSFVAAVADGTEAWATDTTYVNSPDFPLWKEDTFINPSDNPDALKAVAAGWSELLMFGPRSLEFWAPSGDENLFNHVTGAPVERGLISIGAVLAFDNTWFFLDHERKLIRMSGRNPQAISIPYDRPFRSMVYAEDCRAFVIDSRFLCWTFPTADYTLVYDTYSNGWYKWAYFNTTTGQYERFLGQCAVFVPEWNTQFVGGRDGRVYIYHQNLVTDFFNPIRMVAKTGHIDWGTLQPKQSNQLLMRIKRGA